MNEVTNSHTLIARGLTDEQRRHLKAVASGGKYPFSASILEWLVEARLIVVRQGEWKLTDTGRSVLHSLN